MSGSALASVRPLTRFCALACSICATFFLPDSSNWAAGSCPSVVRGNLIDLSRCRLFSFMQQVVRIGAVVCGAIYGAKRLETLKAMEANGELPHQQAGASHHGSFNFVDVASWLSLSFLVSPRFLCFPCIIDVPSKMLCCAAHSVVEPKVFGSKTTATKAEKL